jgi:hypothetical protein
MVRAGAGAGIFDKLEPESEPEPHENGPAPQHCASGRIRILTSGLELDPDPIVLGDDPFSICCVFFIKFFHDYAF